MPARRRSREELLGYYEGVRLRLAGAEAHEGAASPDRAELERARRQIEAGELREAEAALLSIDRRIPREEEVEMMDRPRGLVGYVPTGGRGVPPERHEEPLSNRLALLQKLLAVQRARGFEVERFLPALHEAERAYTRGERARTKEICDRLLGELEALRPGSDPPKEPL